MSRSGTGALDGRGARLAGLGVFALCVGVLAYMHRADLFPGEGGPDAGLNPEFVACRDSRTRDLDSMLAEGLIDATRHTQFYDRAVAFCAAQFPSGIQ